MNLGKMPRHYVPKYRRRLGMVFQDFRLLRDRTVYENVAFAQRVIGVSTRRIKESVPAMLQMVGLSAKYKMFPQQLSGGEQQRVAIARALMSRLVTWTVRMPMRSCGFWRRSTAWGLRLW